LRGLLEFNHGEAALGKEERDEKGGIMTMANTQRNGEEKKREHLQRRADRSD